MSEENVALVRRAFAVLTNDGIDALMAFAARDGVWIPAPEFIEAPEYRGHDGLRFLFYALRDNFEDWDVRGLELRDAGDAVVALFEHGGKLKGTSAPLYSRMGAVYSDFRDGKVARIEFFQTWGQALEAAGLS